MDPTQQRPYAPLLERLPDSTNLTPTPPAKAINDGNDLTFFFSSTAYRYLNIWLLQLNRSMFPAKENNGTVHQNTLTSPPRYSEHVQNLRHLVSDLTNLIEQAPPDTGPRRFGNVAFRTWYKLAEDSADQLCESHLGSVLQAFNDESKRTILKDELKVYLLGSFGSAQRLDYGTGHELSFLAFLGCLWKIGAFEVGDERAIVVGVIQPYLELIRRLVLTYTLEPAGSHGVWGLDDHSFAPYIFGSAQLGPAIGPSDLVPTEGSLKNAPSPSKVADKQAVADYSTMNMYFGAIQFIYDVKRGPFWEHSPVLYDVSGIKDGWAKINKGMLKMYAAEVLGKFPVVQHFPFGNLFRWEADAQAGSIQASTHARQQPTAVPAWGMNAPSAPVTAPSFGAAAGTKAPWAKTSAPEASGRRAYGAASHDRGAVYESRRHGFDPVITDTLTPGQQYTTTLQNDVGHTECGTSEVTKVIKVLRGTRSESDLNERGIPTSIEISEQDRQLSTRAAEDGDVPASMKLEKGAKVPSAFKTQAGDYLEVPSFERSMALLRMNNGLDRSEEEYEMRLDADGPLYAHDLGSMFSAQWQPYPGLEGPEDYTISATERHQQLYEWMQTMQRSGSLADSIAVARESSVHRFTEIYV